MDFVYLKWAFAGYFATSLLCFIFPSLLRTKKKYSFQPFNEAVELKKILKIAHRGAPRYITENTIESFKKAVEAKADMLEMDVCETKDGILVVHHDHDLERTCGVKDKIRDLEFNKLPSFLPTISLNFSKGLTVKSNGEKISTLEQIFKQFPQMPMNIELKTPSSAGIVEMVRLVREYKRQDRTVIGIRSKMQQELKVAGPQMLTFCNDKQVGRLALLYFTGLLPFVQIPQATLQLPLWTTEFYQWKFDTTNNKRDFYLFFGMLKVVGWLARPMIWHLRRRGIMTYYWVCNQKEDVKKGVEYGGCGIMTDRIVDIGGWLQE